MNHDECGKVRAVLPARLDGPLHGREGARVEAHLGACRPCRNELSLFEASRADFRDAASVSPRRDLWPGIRARLGAPEPAAAAPRTGGWLARWGDALPRPRFAFAAGMVAAGALLGYLLGVGTARRPAPATPPGIASAVPTPLDLSRRMGAPPFGAVPVQHRAPPATAPPR